MARQTRSESVFFRFDGPEKRDLFFRINPTAVRWQQGVKGGVTETLGGFFAELFYSSQSQYSGRMLPEFSLEASTGIAYRKELREIDWIWRHQGDRRTDNTPADIYFYDLVDTPPYQGVERAGDRIYLIFIQNFAWDDTVQNQNEIKFSMRCKILRDLFWELDAEPPPDAIALPTLEALTSDTSLDALDLTTPPIVSTTNLPLS